MKFQSLCRTLTVLTAVLTLSGCLRSRAQLQDDSEPEVGVSRGGQQITHSEPQAVQSGGYAVEELKSEVLRLTGKVEDLERQSKGTAESDLLQQKIKSLEERTAELEKSQLGILEGMQKLKEAPKRSPGEVFRTAKETFKSGQVSEAIPLFKEYIASGDSENAEEARYLLGEAFFSKREYKDAIIYYSELNEKNPKSKKAPSALQKIAQSFEKLGYKDDAKNFYQELVEKYPKTPEGRAAKNKLR